MISWVQDKAQNRIHRLVEITSMEYLTRIDLRVSISMICAQRDPLVQYKASQHAFTEMLWSSGHQPHVPLPQRRSLKRKRDRDASACEIWRGDRTARRKRRVQKSGVAP